MKTALFLLVYVAMSWQTSAALFADMQSWSGTAARRSEVHRGDMGVAALFGLIPAFWIVAPFLTGFYQHGWNFMFRRLPGDPLSDPSRVPEAKPAHPPTGSK